MRLSLQVQYAICGCFDIAYNGHDEPVQVRVIGTRQEIPARYLEQIFQRLRKAKLVQGRRGPGGGYVLARSPREISLLEVVEAIEGPLQGNEEPERSPAGPGFLWTELTQGFAEVLSGVTLESLCRDAARQGVRREEPEGYTYQI